MNYNIVNSNGVKIGSRTSYICNVNQHPASNNTSAQSEASWSKPKYRSMPENVEELNACEEELAFEDMFIIKTHVGHGWRNIARRLSYSDGQIEQFEENYKHRGIDEVSAERSKLNIRFEIIFIVDPYSRKRINKKIYKSQKRFSPAYNHFR